MIFDSISIPSDVPAVKAALPEDSDGALSVRNSQSNQRGPFALPNTHSNMHDNTHHTTTHQTAHHTTRRFTETWRGFIKEPIDAQLVIEACVAGVLQPLNVVPMSLSDLTIRSGTVLVFAENSSIGQMVRWRDGKRWSASRLQGPFLLYREVESSVGSQSHSQQIKNQNEDPAAHRFVNTVVRGKTQFVADGMAKRTLTLSGSDGARYRVISYFYPNDVGHLYGDPVNDKGSALGKLVTPALANEFVRFFAKAGSVPQFTMPDLSYAAVMRGLGVGSSGIASGSGSSGIVMNTFGESAKKSGQQSRHDKTPSVSSSTTSEARKHVSEMRHENSFDASNCQMDADAAAAITRISASTFHQHQQFQHHNNSWSPLSAGSNPCACGCTGGLGGIDKAREYFRNDPFWTEFPVRLAPLLCSAGGSGSEPVTSR